MKVLSTIVWATTIAAGVVITSHASAQDKKLRDEVIKEFQNSNKGLVEKIVQVVEKNVQAIIKKHESQIAELKKAVEARDKQIADLRKAQADRDKRIDQLSKKIDAIAAAAKPKKALTKAYLGVLHITPSAAMRAKLKLKDGQGAQIESLAPGGPAAKADFKPGDVIVFIGDKHATSENLRELVGSFDPGAKIQVTALRGDEKIVKEVALVDKDKFKSVVAKPAPPKKVKAELGVLVEEKDSGLEVLNVEKGLTGEIAKLLEGDIISEVNGKAVKTLEDLRETLGSVNVGDELTLKGKRAGAEFTSKVVAGLKAGEAKLLSSDAQEPAAEPEPEPVVAKKPAFLGVQVEEGDGVVKVLSVVEGSTCAAYGLKADDLIIELGGVQVKEIEDIKKGMEGKKAGDSVAIVIRRGEKEFLIREARLGAKDEKVAAPKESALVERKPGFMNLIAEEDGEQVKIVEVSEGGAADKAGLKVNDLIVKIQGTSVKNFADMLKFLDVAFAGDSLTLVVKRGDKDTEVEITLADE